MDPISRIHEIATAKGMNLNFEVAEVRGPAHLREFTMKCDWLNKSYRATANTKKRAIRTICTLIDADISKLPDFEVDTESSEYKIVCQAYGKVAAMYLKDAANSVEGGLQLKGSPPMLERTVPEKFNSKRYITMHVIARLVYDELKLENEFADKDYVTLMANQLRSRMSVKVTHQPDGNVTVSLKLDERKETEQPTEFLFLVNL
ncbi:VP11 [Mangshi virus]|nr:VP11 [Mangshi virus]